MLVEEPRDEAYRSGAEAFSQKHAEAIKERGIRARTPSQAQGAMFRERRNQHLASTGNMAHELFDMAKIRVSVGKTRLRVLIDDHQRFEPGGIYISTTIPSNVEWHLDYAPAFSRV